MFKNIVRVINKAEATKYLGQGGVLLKMPIKKKKQNLFFAPQLIFKG